jgi:hypothetical protein
VDARTLADVFHTFDPCNPPRFRSSRCAAIVRHWNTLRGERPFPSRSDIDPGALKAILPHLMLVGIEYEPLRAFYRLVGTEIARFAKFDFTGRYADALAFQDDGGEDWTRFYREVVEARRPGVGLTSWTVEGGLRRWIEFVICPLSSDGTTIDRCVSLEDYEHLNLTEIDTLPAVSEH